MFGSLSFKRLLEGSVGVLFGKSKNHPGHSKICPSTISAQDALRFSLMHVRKPSKTTDTRGLLATDPIILNLGQVTWTTPELIVGFEKERKKAKCHDPATQKGSVGHILSITCLEGMIHVEFVDPPIWIMKLTAVPLGLAPFPPPVPFPHSSDGFCPVWLGGTRTRPSRASGQHFANTNPDWLISSLH
ncbi:hypothetical protein TNCV_4889041 [Trichonephila clavipes]|nr:hypothetical protein TNCV_4889041 [Trichonephila clavipes]